MAQPDLTVTVLGSSSAGNSTLIRKGITSLLVDCGFTPKYIDRQLAHHGLTIADLSGVLITHTHSDHVNEWFVRHAIKHRIPMYCPPDIELHLQTKHGVLIRASHARLLNAINDDHVEIADCLVTAFPVPHDSPGGCFGYSIQFQVNGTMRKVTVATDIAFPTRKVIEAVADSDIIVLESNHDLDMLENSRRPIWLKKRIRERGHLSNGQCAETIKSAIEKSKRPPESIFLAHVSQECNTNRFAVESASEATRCLGLESINVHETYPFTPSASSSF